MGKKAAFFKAFLSNNLKFAEFALNNICTAKCQFCSIWQQKEKHTVDTEKALAAIDRLHELGVRFMTITGGEPLLHPDFTRIARYCADKNIITTCISADYRVLNDRRIEMLVEGKIDIMGVSIDHHTDEVIMKSRKIPNSIEGIRTAVRKMKERGLTVTASVLICDFNHTSLDALFAKCEELGFDFISANYPVFSPSPTYTLGGDAIKLTRENLIVAMRELLRLKKKYDIVNTGKSIENIITYLEGKTPPFPCLGGYRTFFLDWTFDLYPCMCFEKPLGNVFSLTRKDIRKRTCNLCNMSWYRDFSIFLQGFRSIPPLVQEIARVIRFK